MPLMTEFLRAIIGLTIGGAIGLLIARLVVRYWPRINLCIQRFLWRIVLCEPEERIELSCGDHDKAWQKRYDRYVFAWRRHPEL